jgi:hypothetical protein
LAAAVAVKFRLVRGVLRAHWAVAIKVIQIYGAALAVLTLAA